MNTIQKSLNHLTAQFCAACRIKCRKTQIHSLKRFALGRVEYWPIVLACRDCAVACEAMADLCFQVNPVVARLLIECAKKCEACAAACGAIPDARLSDLSQALQGAARACRCLSRSFWQRVRRLRAAGGTKPSAQAGARGQVLRPPAPKAPASTPAGERPSLRHAPRRGIA
jgi:hypothetical protein